MQLYSNIEPGLAKHRFYYYVASKLGYYEGFMLDIENNFSVSFDNCKDKKNAQKEITELKQFLIDCVGLGLVKCSPGWCTSYSNYNDTIAAIKEVIKDIGEEAKQMPTER